MDEALSQALKLPETVTLDCENPNHISSEKMIDLPHGIRTLYVYCDILEEIPVGDTEAPLLRTVDTNGEFGQMQYRDYEHPRYVPIRKKHFDTIEIDIRSEFGEPVSFISGSSIVTLHLRKIEK
jgi:hypothetical protein